MERTSRADGPRARVRQETGISARPKCKSRRLKLLKRAGVFKGDTAGPGPVIKRATHLDELCAAYELVHHVFVRRGYMRPNRWGVRIRPFEAFPDTATFIAQVNERVVGVTSLVMDSEELGLPADQVFREEIDRNLRAKGRKPGEGTNWVVAEDYRNSSLLTELMRCVYAQAQAVGCDDIVAAVSPGHAAFYGLLGFEQIGSIRSYSKDVEDPVVLMRVGVKERFEGITEADGEEEYFLKKYYVDDNPYPRYVASWSILAERFFSDPLSLRELFVHRSQLLARCSLAELAAIRRRWGEEVFVRVCAVAASAVA